MNSNISLVLFTYLAIPSPTISGQDLELNELVVQSTSEASLTVPSLAASLEQLAKTPGATEVIDADRYLRGRASTVADTFALSAGVFAQPRFGSDEARLSIRGSGLQRTFHGRGIRVLQDGIPINLADGSFDFQALDPLSANYIRIWRGANALAYGSSTLGGAIDYVSHTGHSAPAFSARLEGGSFDYLRGRIAGGHAGAATDLYFSLSDHSQQGFRDHARQSNQRLFGNFGWRLNEHLETRAFLTAVQTDSELPGNLTKAELEANPRRANPLNVGGDHKRDFELYRFGSKTTLTRGDSVWNFTGAWTYKDLLHPIYQVIEQTSHDALVGLNFSHTGELFGREHQFRAGGLYLRGETKASNYLNDSGSRGPLIQRDLHTAANLEAFAESQLALGRGFTGIAGFAASYNLRKTERSFGPAPETSSYRRTFEDLSPKLGLRYDGAQFQVYGNISGSYEPPSFSESGTATVASRAQEATTFEIGSRGSRGAFRWDASLYHATIDHELLAIQLPPPAAIGATGTLNADRTVHQGLELATGWDLLGSAWDEDPANRLVLRTAWTYGRYRFDDDATYGDNQIAGLPPHLIRGELTWENHQGYYAGPTVEWVPVKSYIDHRNTFAADPYFLLGFKVGRRLESGLSWFFEARNLTNEHHAATTGVIENAGGSDQRQFLPGDGRSVYAGLEWKW